MELYYILGLPLLFAVVAVTGLLGLKLLHFADRLTATVVFGLILHMAAEFAAHPHEPIRQGFFYVDSLSIWMLVIVGALYLAFAWTSKAYLERDTNIRYGYLRRFTHLEGRFYALSHLFVWTMMLVVTVDSLGLMWVTIEATTLVSALLVAFKFTRTSLEAAWKYVMVCTVGICLALLGTIILYYGQLQAMGDVLPLNWEFMKVHADMLDHDVAKLAFCFLFVGYGTKIGLAPMHAWLPDAHSEAPALTSGLLSGALCICALYVLLRATAIVMPVVGLDFISSMYVGFGLLTIALAVPFVVVQRDVKRMLAYSSMENFGLLAAGFGLFMPLAAEASLLHMFNHALVKYMLFYTAGTIMETYATKNMMRIHGMMQQAPKTAIFWLLGIVGILGMPPMGVFFSKFYIIASFFQAHHPYLGILALVLLAGMLIGILYHAMRMLGGKPTRKAAGELMGRLDSCVLLLMLAVSGVVSAFAYELPYVGTLLTEAVKVVMGGVQ
ncbi:proton-conducting transporter membrane subunit [Selenomonas ruminantium]|uniref:proton-conducting transporter transmembrane domain-containing protein n=1 Tax=Selenomonas ruminantium TaxID=971 RepID=UPI001569548B|nr:proton-conducting transporter membrane subunit [Selenomonas ruminantium]